MALHKDFPESPYAILDPTLRWFPADLSLSLSQALVAANHELITRFQKKIQATLARVWGEENEHG